MTSKPRILTYDIETLPFRAFTWGLYNQNIPHTFIDKNRTMVTAAWRWLGEKKIHGTSILEDNVWQENVWYDEAPVTKLHAALMEADFLIGHNAVKYDLRFFNARAIQYGLPPLPPKLPTVDTLKVAKKHFDFGCNKLDHLADTLFDDKKLAIVNGLHMKIVKESSSLAVVKRSIQDMLKYNKHDIIISEKLYHTFLPYIDNHPNMNLHGGNEDVCPNCGSTHLHKRGYVTTRVSKKQRLQCQACGSWSQSKQTIQIAEVR